MVSFYCGQQYRFPYTDMQTLYFALISIALANQALSLGIMSLCHFFLLFSPSLYDSSLSWHPTNPQEGKVPGTLEDQTPKAVQLCWPHGSRLRFSLNSRDRFSPFLTAEYNQHGRFPHLLLQIHGDIWKDGGTSAFFRSAPARSQEKTEMTG